MIDQIRFSSRTDPNAFPYTDVYYMYIMSGAGTASNDDEPEMTQVNLRISKAFLEDIDGTWKEEGFNSRSEFLRYAIRDAVKHPAFTREGWKQIAASEHGLRVGDDELVNRDEVVGAMDDDGEQ